MSRLALLVSVVTPLLVADAAAQSGSEAPDPSGAATVESFDWMSGRWTLERQGEYLEEQWSEPAGNSLVGMFRWLRDGRVWLFELVSITAREGELVFTLRHFSADMVAWEERERPLTFTLTRSGPAEAVFENREPEGPRRIIYRRVDENHLRVRVEGEDPEDVNEFAFSRRGDGG